MMGRTLLPKTVLAVLLAVAAVLQCSGAVVMHRLSVAAERYYQEEGENAGDFDGSEDYEYSYERDLKKVQEKADGPQTVLLLSALSGRMIAATEEGLKSDGTMQDPATRFVSTGVSYNSIMLSTIISGRKNLLGIDSEGRIVLDAANSSHVAHEFELVSMNEFEEDTGPVQLRARVGSSYCYIAFDANNLPLHKTCSSEPKAKKSMTETFFSIVPL